MFVLTTQAYSQACLLSEWTGALVLNAGLTQHGLHLFSTQQCRYTRAQLAQYRWALPISTDIQTHTHTRIYVCDKPLWRTHSQVMPVLPFL
jgi:hypothetical protein